MNERPKTVDKTEAWCMDRRTFLFTGAKVLTAAMVVELFPWGPSLGQGAAASRAGVLLASYPRKQVGTLSGLRESVPQEFFYPNEHPNCATYLVKLGVSAGGGGGPQGDIVAFNRVCPHMGGPLAGQYKAAYQVLGPCPLHLSTFDLTRHGMVVAGHATQGLPQVVLELEGDAIYAVGLLGLMYGFDYNLRPA